MTDRASRLDALRREMETFEADGFIVPRADEHQGEYVAGCSERLAWISGFTGSAGLAIVLKERAAVFVDGRYTIQVQNEVSGDLFDYRHVTDSPASEWLADHLKAGQVLAYDPWLHTGPSLHRIKAAVEKAGAKLVAAPHNFIDAVWADRPEPPLHPVFVQPLDYAGVDHVKKLETMALELKESGQDAMVLSLPDSIAWLFNIRGGDIPCTPVALGFAIVYANATADLFMDQRKISTDIAEHLGKTVTVREPEELENALDQLGTDTKTVRIDGSSAPKWVHKRLSKAGATVSIGADLTLMPKACKNEVEQAGTRQAHKRDGATMVRFLHWLSEQPASEEINEITVAAKLDGLRKEDDLFVDYSFETISGASENGAMCHYRVSEESSIPLPENGLYLVDSGGQYKDGTTDITRTIARGTPSQEMIDRYTVVLKGHLSLGYQRFPQGTTGSQLDALARAPIWQAGLDFDHGTGHGVGSFLSVHEGPQRISKMPNSIALRPGMIISNEPGYYKDGGYGIRIENLVCVQPSEKKAGEDLDVLEFEQLTLCPYDRALINVDLLNETEIAQVNAYHERVREELTPMLGGAEAAWLANATQPL